MKHRLPAAYVQLLAASPACAALLGGEEPRDVSLFDEALQVLEAHWEEAAIFHKVAMISKLGELYRHKRAPQPVAKPGPAGVAP